MTTPKLKEFFQPGLLIVLGMGGICKKIANLLKDHGNIPIDSQYGSALDQYQ